MPEQDRDFGSVLDRWFIRMRRSHSFYAGGTFADEAFEDFVAVLVTSAMLEALLYLGIQVVGFRVQPGTKKSLTLGRLINEANNRGLSDDLPVELLKRFNDIRNDVAHNIDYRLTPDDVQNLFALLPQTYRQEIQRACENMFPASHFMIARLTFEQIAALTYKVVRDAWLLAAEQ